MIGVVGNVFLDLGIIISVAAIAAYLLKLIKQPQILAYVLVGVLIGPVFKLVTDTDIVQSMSMMGIAFLLFLVGLEMDLKSLKNVALVSSLGGFIQVIIIAVFGYLIALALGFLSIEAAYIGLMLAFSSTMVVMKLLSDKRELNTLHGRLAVGILLVQDIVAIFALSLLNSVDGFNLAILGVALIKFLGLFLLAYLVSKFIFPYIFKFAAKNNELLLISSLAVCFMFSLAFYYLGFSIAIGAFVAGIALGSLEYNIEIIGRVKSLKDFFALIFFVSLGMGISLGVVKSLWFPIVILLLFIIFVKPLIIMTVCSLFKYTKRPSFLTAISLAQIGEFSLILAAQGLLLGHLSNDFFSMAVIITIISITFTSYSIQWDQQIYALLKFPLKIFDIFTIEGLEYLPTETNPKIILCGHNRIGYSILKNLEKQKKQLLVIDYNPEVINRLIKQGVHCIYGEVTDDEIIARMNLPHISMLISTVPNLNENLYLIKSVRSVNKRAKILVTSQEIENALKLYGAGADYVIMPHFLGGEHASNLIVNIRKKKIKIKEEKLKHIKHLHERREVGHNYPKEA